MKILEGFITFLLGLLTFILVLSLSLIIRTKSFVEKEILTTVVKETTKEAVDNSSLDKKQKEFIDNIINDKDSSKILNRIEKNYIKYQKDSNYTLSKDDYELVIGFILKHQDDVNALYKTNFTEEQIREAIKYEDVQTLAKNSFNDLTTSPEAKEANDVLNVYINLTSSATKLALVGAIIFLLALVALVNWSIIKCLKVLGIDLIICGALIGSLFTAAQIALGNIVADEEVLNIINNINLNGFIIMAVCELVIGIILVVIYKRLKKNKPQEEDKKTS